MDRIAYVAQVKHGKEPECREILKLHMPTGGLKRLGIGGLEAFIGSGYFIMVLDHDAPDTQAFLQRFFNDKGMRGFLDQFRPFVEGLPEPEEAYTPGGATHTGGQSAAPPGAAVPVTSAELPLADSAYRWTVGDGEQPA